MQTKPTHTPVSQEKRSVVTASFASRFVPLGGGCFRDNGNLLLAADGSRYVLEWTPTLNASAKSRAKCIELIAKFRLAGGGFEMPTKAELFTLVNPQARNPATFDQLKEDTQPDWYWTNDLLASSPDCAWYVYFNHGYVDWSYSDYFGFARGVRRVVVSPGQ